ncbi:MAG: DUF2191 domain-containing protein [Steroidobacteraceae bacterium]
MKTTIDISDLLLEQAKKVAADERTTVRALIEQGLRQVLTSRTQPAAFRLREAAFHGEGLQPEAEGLPWEHIRDMIYSGRGS